MVDPKGDIQETPGVRWPDPHPDDPNDRSEGDEDDMERIIEQLKSLRVGKILEEYDLQNKIAALLDSAGIPYQREYRLGKGSRVDFLAESGVAIEVKKGKPNRTQLVGQVDRYAAYGNVEAVIIVIETSLRMPITHAANGKRCVVVGLQRLWGISL